MRVSVSGLSLGPANSNEQVLRRVRNLVEESGMQESGWIVGNWEVILLSLAHGVAPTRSDGGVVTERRASDGAFLGQFNVGSCPRQDARTRPG